MDYGLGFGHITPMKENFRGVKVRCLTKAVAIFLGLKEEEHQIIWCLATTNTLSREQKAYQCDVWNKLRGFFIFFPIFVRFQKNIFKNFFNFAIS